MRNLKKILALVLALIMSLSLMATAGAGSFQDVNDDNPYKTAIDVLDELKVFQGFEDGSFKPTDTLNRAQAAVLVYRIATGDVEGKQVENYTYMAQSKFDDLEGYNWAKGYINYCQNAKIVVGTSATKFSPEAPVTGYQLMVMLLRTLGYGAAGEFTDPKGWELETAKIAEREGILKNITGGNYGAPAQRQMVAEILFQGLLQETVQYSALTPGGYTKSGVILGEKVGLEDIEGVVIANEIASLIDDKPLAEGKTWLDVDGKTVRLDVASKGEDLGTMMHAYVKDSKPITGLTASDSNDIKTNEGAKTTVSKLKGTLKLTDDTQYFNNYGELLTDTSDYRIEYDVPQKIVDTLKYTDEQMSRNGCTIDGKTPDANGVYTSAAGDTWNKVIRVGRTITAMDLSIIHEIFTWDDAKTNGKVYAGTQTTDDLSDDYSWNEFKAKYLNRDVKDALDGCDIGESLRVIDNDGDGVADYVLRVEFVMTVITDYEKRTETYTVEYDEDTSDRIKGTEIKAGDIVCADELAIGDVILYAKIDGVYYVSHPETETVKVDKKGINTKAGTFTVDGETYTWSEIDEKAEAYYEELVEIAPEASYIIYKDWFGNVRLAADPSRGFYLLTDGYFYTNKRDSETKATMFVDGKLGDFDVKDFDVDLDTSVGFIDESEETDKSNAGNRGTWERLNAFEKIYQVPGIDPADLDKDGKAIKFYDTYSDFATNIAAAALADDVYSLDPVDDETILRYDRLYEAYEIAGTNGGMATTTPEGQALKAGSVKSNDRTLWGIDGYSNDNGSWSASTRIQTRTDTVYYYVSWDSKGNTEVTTWTGYNSSDAPKAFAPELAYAVTYEGTEGKYQVAAVVVFEGAKAESAKNAWLVTDGRTVNDVYALGVDGDGNYGRTLKDWKLFNKSELALTQGDLLEELLTLRTDKAVEVEDHFADYGVYAGTVTVGADITRGDYVRIRENNTSNVEYFSTADVDSWELVLDVDNADNARKAISSDKGERLNVGDQVIYMTNANDDVALIINVTKSHVKGDAETPITRLVTLHNDIATEQGDTLPALTIGTYTAKAAVAGGTISLTGVPYGEITKGTKIEVTNGKIILGDTKLVAGTTNYAGTILGDDGQYYPFTITVTAGQSEAGLYYMDVTESVATTSSFPGNSTTMNTLASMYHVKAGSGATMSDWTFYDGNNKEQPGTATFGDGWRAVVTVTSENGTVEKLYTIWTSNETDVLGDVYKRIQKTVYDVYLTDKAIYTTREDALKDDLSAKHWDTGVSGPSWAMRSAVIAILNSDLFDSGLQIVENETACDGVRGSDGTVTALTDWSQLNSVDGKRTILQFETLLQKFDGSVDSSVRVMGPTVVVNYVCAEAAAAKEELKDMDLNVYYSEWHAKTDGSSSYNKQGAAEYVSQTDAQQLKKPDGLTSFGLPYTGAYESANHGEVSMVYIVNKALVDAGIDASIKVTGHDTFVEDETKWGTDPDGSKSPMNGDTATYTANYRLFNAAGDRDYGTDVSITYTLNAVIVSWNGGAATYPQDVPADYWE